jgi:hypothetical protein
MTKNYNLPPGVTDDDIDPPDDEPTRDIEAEKGDHKMKVEEEDP